MRRNTDFKDFDGTLPSFYTQGTPSVFFFFFLQICGPAYADEGMDTILVASVVVAPPMKV